MLCLVPAQHQRGAAALPSPEGLSDPKILRSHDTKNHRSLQNVATKTVLYIYEVGSGDGPRLSGQEIWPDPHPACESADLQAGSPSGWMHLLHGSKEGAKMERKLLLWTKAMGCSMAHKESEAPTWKTPAWAGGAICSPEMGNCWLSAQ